MNCPTRRKTLLYPNLGFSNPIDHWANGLETLTPTMARTDYAANIGDNIGSGPYTVPPYWGPWDYADGDDPRQANQWNWANYASMSGISFQRSQITAGQVTDGTSNTYLIGEKNLDPDYYITGQDGGDDSNVYSGNDDDVLRSGGYCPSATNVSENGAQYTCPKWTYLPPTQDTPGDDAGSSFGSAHEVFCHMAMCDGSVRPINYSIDPEVHRRLCNRHDGLQLDPKSF